MVGAIIVQQVCDTVRIVPDVKRVSRAACAEAKPDLARARRLESVPTRGTGIRRRGKDRSGGDYTGRTGASVWSCFSSSV